MAITIPKPMRATAPILTPSNLASSITIPTIANHAPNIKKITVAAFPNTLISNLRW